MSTLVSCGADERRLAGDNPLLGEWDTPFGVAPLDRVVPEHYVAAFDAAIERLRSDVYSISQGDKPATFEGVAVALDGAVARWADLCELFDMDMAARYNDDFRRVSDELKPRIAAADDEVWMNAKLFERVKAVYADRDNLEGADRRLVEKIYDRFVRGGALLTADQQSLLADINAQEALLCGRYSHNLMAANEGFVLNLNSTQLTGIPYDIRLAAREEALSRGMNERWAFTLNTSSMIPFLTSSRERDLREAIYKAYQARCAAGSEFDNSDIVRQVTKLRQQRAQLMGYANHAEYVVSQQMAPGVDSVYKLLDTVWSSALAGAERELSDLMPLFKKDNPNGEFEPWDWWYYAEKSRSSKFGLTDELLNPYMTLDNVRIGAFGLANKLYGLSFRPVDVPLYDSECRAYEVLDRDTRHLGILYLDMFAREGKGQGAWCGALRTQRYEAGERVDPVVAMVCNFMPARTNAPSMLTLDQAETFFHEFGHALHFMLQDVPYRLLADVEGDFVEFPSQVMENWALEPELMREYAFHYNSRSMVSDDILKKVARSKHFNKGFETLSYTAAALLDMELHRLDESALDTLDLAAFEQRVLSDERGMIAQIAPKYHLVNFPHLYTYDYSAGYYFYLWAEVLDQDCFEQFRQSGNIFSPDVARRLRREVLERGGSADGMTLYRNFRGGEPELEPMLKSKGFR